MMVFFVGWRDFVLGPPLIINHQKTSKTTVNSPSHQQHFTGSAFHVTFCEAKNHVPRSHWWQHPGCDHPRGWEGQTCCQGRAWREWAPFSWRSGERSWHDFAAAKDQSPRTTTQHVLRCRFQSQDLLVSQWHSLPQGTGTFPTAYLGANSLCVRCVAMLPLPSKLSNYKMRDLPAQNIDTSDDSQ